MEGKVFSYIHFNGQIGSMVKISTMTDFAARTDEFNLFGKSMAQQIAMTNPNNVDDLLEQQFIRDDTISIKDMISAMSKELGEKITIEDFSRFNIK